LDLGIRRDKLPEKEWLLMTLSTLNPEHRLFAPSFQPESKKKSVNVVTQPLINNVNNMYDNMPLHSGANRAARGGGLSKKQRLEYAMKVQ